MKKKHTKNKANKKMKEKPKAPSVSEIKSLSKGDESSNTNGSSDDATTSQPQQVQPPNNSKMTISDKINLASAIVTFFVLLVAIGQTKYAQDSAREAIKADSAVMKQFEVINEPYLAMGDMPKFKKFNINEIVSIEYDIKNIGNYPVKLNTSGVSFVYQPTSFDTDTTLQNKVLDSLKIRGKTNANVIVTKDIPALRIYTSLKPLSFTVQQSIGILYETLNLYFLGNCSYVNLVTGKEKEFRFIIKVFDRNGTSAYDYIRNENRNVPDTKK